MFGADRVLKAAAEEGSSSGGIVKACRNSRSRKEGLSTIDHTNDGSKLEEGERKEGEEIMVVKKSR